MTSSRRERRLHASPLTMNTYIKTGAKRAPTICFLFIFRGLLWQCRCTSPQDNARVSTLYQTVSLRRYEFDEAISWDNAVENFLTSSIFTASLENAGSGCGRHRTDQLGGDRRSLWSRDPGSGTGIWHGTRSNWRKVLTTITYSGSGRLCGARMRNRNSIHRN